MMLTLICYFPPSLHQNTGMRFALSHVWNTWGRKKGGALEHLLGVLLCGQSYCSSAILALWRGCNEKLMGKWGEGHRDMESSRERQWDEQLVDKQQVQLLPWRVREHFSHSWQTVNHSCRRWMCFDLAGWRYYLVSLHPHPSVSRLGPIVSNVPTLASTRGPLSPLRRWWHCVKFFAHNRTDPSEET